MGESSVIILFYWTLIDALGFDRYLGQNENKEIVEKCYDLDLDIEDTEERIQKATEKAEVVSSIDKRVKTGLHQLGMQYLACSIIPKSSLNISSVSFGRFQWDSQAHTEDLKDVRREHWSHLQAAPGCRPRGGCGGDRDSGMETRGRGWSWCYGHICVRAWSELRIHPVDIFREDEEKRRRRALKTTEEDDGIQEEEEIPSMTSIKRQSQLLVTAKQTPGFNQQRDRRSRR